MNDTTYYNNCIRFIILVKPFGTKGEFNGSRYIYLKDVLWIDTVRYESIVSSLSKSVRDFMIPLSANNSNYFTGSRGDSFVIRAVEVLVGSSDEVILTPR